MAEERINRKLAAIFAADVVGYSRLMAADEAGTLAALKRHHELVFDPAVAAHNGRIVKLIGDGTIVEFGSVVDAVNCAVSVQRSNRVLRDEASGQAKIILRIGINLGDVIIEGDDIYGDGVNIAARLEPLAEPGGICVSSIVNESIGNRIDVRFQDGGEISVKNIDRPIRVWKWHPGATPLAAVKSNAALRNLQRQFPVGTQPIVKTWRLRRLQILDDTDFVGSPPCELPPNRRELGIISVRKVLSFFLGLFGPHPENNTSTCYRAGQFSLAQDAENFRAKRIVPTPQPGNPRATTPTGIYDRPEVGLSTKQIIGLIDDQGWAFAINCTVYAGTSRFDADKRFRH